MTCVIKAESVRDTGRCVLGELSGRLPIHLSGKRAVGELLTSVGVVVWRRRVPLLAKLGCNSSGCHGKQGGQNGFQLSVFGFDPRGDYEAIVKQGRGRRLFPAGPHSSLLIAKATGATPHGGGRRIAPSSLDARLLTAWIAQGAPWGSGDTASVPATPANAMVRW